LLSRGSGEAGAWPEADTAAEDEGDGHVALPEEHRDDEEVEGHAIQIHQRRPGDGCTGGGINFGSPTPLKENHPSWPGQDGLSRPWDNFRVAKMACSGREQVIGGQLAPCILIHARISFCTHAQISTYTCAHRHGHVHTQARNLTHTKAYMLNHARALGSTRTRTLTQTDKKPRAHLRTQIPA